MTSPTSRPPLPSGPPPHGPTGVSSGPRDILRLPSGVDPLRNYHALHQLQQRQSQFLQQHHHHPGSPHNPSTSHSTPAPTPTPTPTRGATEASDPLAGLDSPTSSDGHRTVLDVDDAVSAQLYADAAVDFSSIAECVSALLPDDDDDVDSVLDCKEDLFSFKTPHKRSTSCSDTSTSYLSKSTHIVRFQSMLYRFMSNGTGNNILRNVRKLVKYFTSVYS